MDSCVCLRLWMSPLFGCLCVKFISSDWLFVCEFATICTGWPFVCEVANICTGWLFVCEVMYISTGWLIIINLCVNGQITLKFNLQIQLARANVRCNMWFLTVLQLKCFMTYVICFFTGAGLCMLGVSFGLHHGCENHYHCGLEAVKSILLPFYQQCLLQDYLYSLHRKASVVAKLVCFPSTSITCQISKGSRSLPILCHLFMTASNWRFMSLPFHFVVCGMSLTCCVVMGKLVNCEHWANFWTAIVYTRELRIV